MIPKNLYNVWLSSLIPEHRHEANKIHEMNNLNDSGAMMMRENTLSTDDVPTADQRSTTQTTDSKSDMAVQTLVSKSDMATQTLNPKSDFGTQTVNLGSDMATQTLNPKSDFGTQTVNLGSDVATQSLIPKSDFSTQTIDSRSDMATQTNTRRNPKSDFSTQTIDSRSDMATQTNTRGNPKFDMGTQTMESDMGTQTLNSKSDMGVQTSWNPRSDMTTQSTTIKRKIDDDENVPVQKKWSTPPPVRSPSPSQAPPSHPSPRSRRDSTPPTRLSPIDLHSCKLCHSTFSRLASLKRHMTNIHKISTLKRKPAARRPQPGQVKDFYDRRALEDHDANKLRKTVEQFKLWK